MKKEKLDIVFEDKYLLVVNKKSNILTISTDKIKTNTLYFQVYDYIKKKNKNNKIFIVNRLDKDTSGLVVFAKDEKIKKDLQDEWNNIAKRYYIAVLDGKISKDRGTITQYLKETKTLKTITTNAKDGKKAITHYSVINKTKSYSLVNINIETGRKNQIRVAMQSINHSIIGDMKYGNKRGSFRRLMLHHYKLCIKHPITNENLIIESKIPKCFNIYFNCDFNCDLTFSQK